jgi:hypothetical protein
MYKLTQQEYELIVGQWFDIDRLFGPRLDINGDWFISQVEVEECTNEAFLWVKDLQPSEFIPAPLPITVL